MEEYAPGIAFGLLSRRVMDGEIGRADAVELASAAGVDDAAVQIDRLLSIAANQADRRASVQRQ